VEDATSSTPLLYSEEEGDEYCTAWCCTSQEYYGRDGIGWDAGDAAVVGTSLLINITPLLWSRTPMYNEGGHQGTSI